MISVTMFSLVAADDTIDSKYTFVIVVRQAVQRPKDQVPEASPPWATPPELVELYIKELRFWTEMLLVTSELEK